MTGPGYGRVHTRPTFSETPADAPILHPTGPIRLEVKVKPFLKLDAPTGTGRERVTTHAFHVIGQLYVDGFGSGTRFLLETSTLNCKIELPLADGTTEIKEMRLVHSVDGKLYQSNSATHPEGIVDGVVKNTVSMPPSARGLTVEPIVVAKPLAELRAVRREDKAASVSQVPSRERLAVDADEAVATLAWRHGGGTMVFNSDRSRRATSTGNEQTVEIRNEESGETLVTFREQPTRIYSLAFSPNGKRVTSGSLGKWVHEIKTRREVTRGA